MVDKSDSHWKKNIYIYLADTLFLKNFKQIIIYIADFSSLILFHMHVTSE